MLIREASALVKAKLEKQKNNNQIGAKSEGFLVCSKEKYEVNIFWLYIEIQRRLLEKLKMVSS